MFRTIDSLVKETLVKLLEMPKDKVTDEAKVYDDLGADSLDVIEVIMAIEEEAGIEIDDAEAKSVGPNPTVKDIVGLVERITGRTAY